jgi:hypothetical protein
VGSGFIFPSKKIRLRIKTNSKLCKFIDSHMFLSEISSSSSFCTYSGMGYDPTINLLITMRGD